MAAILNIQSLTIPNALEVGGIATGDSSTFFILPGDGYVISASQFSLAPGALDDYPEIESVAFSNTGTPFTYENQVAVSVLWNGVTLITDTYFFNPQIVFDNTIGVYDSGYTELSFSVNSILAAGSSANISIEPCIGSNIANNILTSETIVDNVVTHNVTADVTSSTQVDVVDITYTANNGGGFTEGYARLNINELTATVNQSINSDGTFTVTNLDFTEDLFGSVYKATYRVSYTRSDNSSIDTDTAINIDVATTTYSTSFVSSYIFDQDGHDEFQIKFVSNIGSFIPDLYETFDQAPPNSFSFTYTPDTFVSNGTTSNTLSGSEYTFHVDVLANPSGSTRDVTITLKDTFYNITRATQTITQQATNFINAKISNIGLSDIVELGTYQANADFLTSLEITAGKVISIPNGIDGDNTYEGGGGGDYGVPNDEYVGIKAYSLVVATDSSVTLSDFTNNNINLNIDQQEIYPLDTAGDQSGFDGWVVFNFDDAWTEVGTNIFARQFYIRNQDAFDQFNFEIPTADRNATITVTHPTTNETSSVTIEQDKRYNSSLDKVQAKTVKPAGSTATNTEFSAVAYVEGSTLQTTTVTTTASVGVGTYETRLKFLDFETNFNLFNNVTTDPTSHTFKQYPLPRFTTSTSGVLYADQNEDGLGYVIYDDNSFYQDHIDDAELIYNSDYDSSDPNNDHHYTFRWQMSNNDAFSTRSVFFYWFHPENEKALAIGNHDLRLKVTQSALASLEASIVNSSGNIAPLWDLDTPFPLSNDGAANSRTVRIIYSGDVAPTIGIFKETILGITEYIALAPNTSTSTLFGVDDGFSYSSPTTVSLTDVDGANAIEIVVSCEANPFGEGSKQVNFAFWHATLDPTQDDPSDIIAFTQGEAAYDPNIQAVQVFSNTSPTSLSSGGGVIKFLINVEDYATTPSTPDVEVYAWAGPNFAENGNLIDVNGDYTTVSSLTGSEVISSTWNLTQAGLVLFNPQFLATGPLTNYNGDEVSYTHYVEIPYTPYAYNEPYYILVKAKHSAAPTFDDDDIIMYTLVDNAEEVFIRSVGIPSGDIISTNAANVKVVEIPGDYGIDSLNGENFNIQVSYNRPEELSTITDLPFGVSIADYIPVDADGVSIAVQQRDAIVYGNLPSYIYARFINPAYINESTGAVDNANASVWTNPSNGVVLNSDASDAYSVQNALSTTHDLPTGFNHFNYGNIDLPLVNSGYVIKNNDFSPNTLGGSSGSGSNTSDNGPDTLIYESEGYESTYLGSHSFDIQLKVKAHDVNATVESVLGIWTGKSLPKTNLYTLNTSFVSSSASFQTTQVGNIVRTHNSSSNINQDNAQGQTNFGNLNNSQDLTITTLADRINVFNNYIIESFDNSGDGNHDSFHFNSNDTYYFDIYTDAMPNYKHFQFSFCLFDQSSGSFLATQPDVNQEYFVEFEIENYEDNLPDVGDIPIPGLEMPNAQAILAHLDDTSFNQPFVDGIWNSQNDLKLKLRNLTKVKSNGFYRTRIRLKDASGEGGIHVPFVARVQSKFTLKNLNIYKVGNEPMLEPGTTSIFTTPPDDYIYIKHLPKPSVAIAFASFNASNNSPFNAQDVEQGSSGFLQYFPSLGVNLPNSTGAGIQGDVSANNEFRVYIASDENGNFGQPHLRVWDGNNSSSLSDVPWIFSVNVVAGYNSSPPYYLFELVLDNNYTGFSRQITLGLYDGVPADTTISPLDTYIIAQAAANPALDFPGSTALQGFSSGTAAGGVPISFHWTGVDGTKLININGVSTEYHVHAVIPFEPFTNAHLADYTNDDSNNFGLYKITVSNTDQLTTLNTNSTLVGTEFTTFAHPTLVPGSNVGTLLEDLHTPVTNTYYKAYNDPTLDSYNPGKNFTRTLSKENISTVSFKPGINFESVGRYLVIHVYEGLPNGYSYYSNIEGYYGGVYNFTTSLTPPIDTFVIYQMPFGQTFDSTQSALLSSTY